MSEAQQISVASGPMQAHAFRLHPGNDLVSSLQHAVKTVFQGTGAKSCFVMTAVGSLSAVTLRLANANRSEAQTKDNANDIRSWKDERFEVVSLVGTFSADPAKFHLHISISDAKGVTYGGHLVSGTVFTTMEIVLGTIQGVSFNRTMDPLTGYRELSLEEHATVAINSSELEESCMKKERKET